MNYEPSSFIVTGKHVNSRNTPKGIYMRLPIEKQQRMRILKTKMNCETWEEFVDKILLWELEI